MDGIYRDCCHKHLKLKCSLQLISIDDRPKDTLSPEHSHTEEGKKKKSPRSRSPFAKLFGGKDKGQKSTPPTSPTASTSPPASPASPPGSPAMSPQVSPQEDESPSLRISGWSLGYFITSPLCLLYPNGTYALNHHLITGHPKLKHLSVSLL